MVEQAEEIPSVEDAWPSLRALLDAIGRPYRIVGGVAVIHHGYVRATRDLDVLVDDSALEDTPELDELLARLGFSRSGPRQLRHETGVTVDLLVAGSPSPRVGEVPYPQPEALGASERDPAFVDLAGLVLLKLIARRAQDRADVGALLKRRTESHRLHLEVALPPERRALLRKLWREAREELAMERFA